MLDAVGFLHKVRIVHRDIKPRSKFYRKPPAEKLWSFQIWWSSRTENFLLLGDVGSAEGFYGFGEGENVNDLSESEGKFPCHCPTHIISSITKKQDPIFRRRHHQIVRLWYRRSVDTTDAQSHGADRLEAPEFDRSVTLKVTWKNRNHITRCPTISVISKYFKHQLNSIEHCQSPGWCYSLSTGTVG